MLLRRRIAVDLRPAHFDTRGLPRFLLGGGFNIWPRHHELGEHAHAHGWEIHYLVDGRITQATVHGTHLMRAGDLMIAAPGVAHSGVNRVHHRCALFWLSVDWDARDTLTGIPPALSTRLFEAFRRLGSTPVAGEPELLAAFTGLLRESADHGAMRELLCQSHLHAILALIARSAEAARAIAVRRHSPPIARCIDLLGGMLDARPTTADLTRAAGLSRSALHERFLAEVGMTPAELHMQLRLEEAKRLLPAASNAVVAERLGFSSTSHFISAFRRAYGVTPGSWKTSRGPQ
jgi:AraC-like DNA-binding protein